MPNILYDPSLNLTNRSQDLAGIGAWRGWDGNAWVRPLNSALVDPLVTIPIVLIPISRRSRGR